MKISDGKQKTEIKLSQAELEEGQHEAIIEEIEILKNCNTQFGQKDAIEITYSIDRKVYKIEKKERIFMSQSPKSRFMKLIKEMYDYDVPEEIELERFKGERCLITIEHQEDKVGNVYDNIVKREFPDIEL